jgi:hypothetical protein
MMTATTVMFDTHRLVRRLKGAGFNDQQAEALTDTVQAAQSSADVATKQDIKDSYRGIGDLSREIGQLRQDIDREIGKLRENIDTKLEKLSLRLMIWLGSIVFLVINTGPIFPKLLHLSG